jgi:hypothetical protein
MTRRVYDRNDPAVQLTEHHEARLAGAAVAASILTPEKRAAEDDAGGLENEVALSEGREALTAVPIKSSSP